MACQRRFNADRLNHYLSSGRKRIDGWFNKTDAQLIRSIGDLQTANGDGGSVCEIGVFHGKSFVLLYLLLHEGESALAVDVFHHPESILLKHVEEFCGDTDALSIRKADSLKIGPQDVLDTVGPVRLFSVDGNHNRDYALHDLKLAADTLSDEGVMIVDDYFNPLWPGVANALHDFMAANDTLKPFALSQNKAYFCRAALADDYRSGLTKMVGAGDTMQAEFFGSQVSVHLPPPKTQKRRSRFSRLKRLFVPKASTDPATGHRTEG